MTLLRIKASRRQLFTGAGALAITALLPTRSRAQDVPPQPPLSVFGKLPLVESVRLSPNGSRVALSMDREGQKVIFDYDLATGTSAASALGGITLRDLMWIDDDTIFSVSTQTANLREFVGDNNTYAVGVIMNIRAGKTFQCYAGMEDFASVVMGDYYRIKTDDGYRITASNVKLSVDGVRCLYAFNPKNGRGLLMDQDPRDISDWAVEADGHILGRSEHDRDTGVWTLRYRDGKTWKAIYTEQSAIDAPVLEGLGRDGKTLLVSMNSGPKAGGYYEVGPDGAFSAPLPLPGSDSTAIFHPVTNCLAGFHGTDSSGRTVYRFFDPVMARLPGLIDKALADSYFNTLETTAENPLKTVIYSEGPGDTGTYYFIDFATGAFKTVGQKYPDLPGEWVGDKRQIRYHAADGLEIEAFITLPPVPLLKDGEAKNLACIVMPHGGPQAHDDIAFDWMSQALASRGYLVLQPNFRGSDNYGQDFVDKGHGQWGRKMQTDLSDGVRELVKLGLVDPKKVAIAGASYGGYAALAGVTLDPGVYTCAVAIAPVSDLKSFVEWSALEEGKNYDSSRVQYWKRFMGDEASWPAVSPAQQAAKVSVPVMLIHGKDDDTVPIEQSYRMRDGLQKAGKAVEVVLLKDEDHYLSKEQTRVQTLEAMIGFLLRHNPPT